MSTILNLIQGSDDWHQHRQKYRNASETPAVLGLSPWITPYQLWEIKTGRRVQEANFAMQRGTSLEPEARTAYEKSTGQVMEPLVVVDGEYSASLDGISLNGDLLLEVKCPVKGRDSETWKSVEAGSVPEHYYWQVQHQLMVSKAEFAHFYVYDGVESGIWIEVLPSLEHMDQIRTAWELFSAFVTSDSPPPLTEKDTVIREDAAWQVAANNYMAQKLAAEEAIKVADHAKAELVNLVQHNSEKGFGVSVCKFWKSGSGKQEVRVSVSKGEKGALPC